MCVVMTCMIHVLLRCLISEVLQEEAFLALVFWLREASGAVSYYMSQGRFPIHPVFSPS